METGVNDARREGRPTRPGRVGAPRAGAEVADLFRGRELVDLTLTIAEDLPCWWPTHQPFQHKIWNWYADVPAGPLVLRSRSGPYQTRWMAIDEHTGTHFDAPAHFIPREGTGLPNAGPAGEITGDRVPVEQLMGPARVIDCRRVVGAAEPGVSPEITADQVRRWEGRYGEIRPGEVVLFWTGWDRFYRPGPEGGPYVEDVLVRRTHPGWPAPGPDAVEHLLRRGVRCLGTDGPSLGAAHDGAPVHVLGLSRGMVFVEGLTGLGGLPASGAWFAFLPVKVRDSTGGTGRAIAVR
ncbi:MAG TPA: cyclase family protein [Candidatus Dormibacteraeota bacterium]|nr:cyclase family protein [Candidatus Dormibacteraeota bacterium]